MSSTENEPSLENQAAMAASRYVSASCDADAAQRSHDAAQQALERAGIALAAACQKLGADPLRNQVQEFDFGGYRVAYARGHAFAYAVKR